MHPVAGRRCRNPRVPFASAFVANLLGSHKPRQQATLVKKKTSKRLSFAGACAMTTVFLDNKFALSIFSILVAFSTKTKKNSVLDAFLICPQFPPPSQKNAKILFFIVVSPSLILVWGPPTFTCQFSLRRVRKFLGCFQCNMCCLSGRIDCAQWWSRME